MGGEGSMMNANVSLRNNRDMISKRKGKSFLSGSYTNTQLKEFPEATEVLLKGVKDRIQKENRKAATKQWLLFIGVLIVIIFVFLYLIS